MWGCGRLRRPGRVPRIGIRMRLSGGRLICSSDEEPDEDGAATSLYVGHSGRIECSHVCNVERATYQQPLAHDANPVVVTTEQPESHVLVFIRWLCGSVRLLYAFGLNSPNKCQIWSTDQLPRCRKHHLISAAGEIICGQPLRCAQHSCTPMHTGHEDANIELKCSIPLQL